MGVQNSVVKNRFGEFYKVELPRDNNAQLTLKAESFWNEESTQQFINNLTVPNGYWREIVSEYSTLPSPSSLTTNEIEQRVSVLMMRGQLKLYPVDIPDIVEHPPEKRVIKSSDNIIYRFAPISSLLLSNVAETKSFQNLDEAKEFLSNLNATEEQLSTIANELDIKLPATASVNQGEIIEVISQELAAGNIIIIIDKTSSTPPTKKETLNKSNIGNRAAGLGAGVSATKESKAEDKEKTCELTTFKVKCKHGRSVEMKKGMAGMLEFDVIASETYENDFEKITATVKISDICGEHLNNTSSIQPTPISTVKTASSNIYTLSCKPYTNPVQNIWLPSVKPVNYKLYPNAHKKFTPSGVVVNVFPKIKWDGEVAYSFSEKESKRAENKNGDLENTHKNNPSKFTGKLELSYDGKKNDIAAEYKESIEQVLNKLDWIRDKVDKILTYFDGGESITLTVGWPNIKIAYSSELKESSGREITSDYKFSIGASPLIEIKGAVDFYPVLMRTLPATHGVYKVLEQVKKGIGNEKSIAHLQGEIKLELTVSSAIHVNFISSGSNGKDNNNNKAESAIDIRFQLEGSVSAKGHVWVIKFEKAYEVGVKSGFVGKVIVDRDDEGFYWYSRFLFNGLIIYFTKYDKIEKEISNSTKKSKKFGVNQIVTQSTKEWVCIQPDPDEEAPYETEGFEKQLELDASDKHYLLRF